MRSRRRLLSVGLAVVLALGIAGETSAITWSPAKALTASGSGFGYPGALAVSSTTLIHAVYEQPVYGSFAVHYRRSADSGSSWSTPITLSRSTVGEAGVPVVEANGLTVDAAWIESDDIIGGVDAVLVYRRSLDGGQSWQDPVVLSPGLESAGYPRLARSGGQVAAIWTNEYTGKVYLRISRDNGSTWGARLNLGGTIAKPFGGSILEAYPTIAFGSRIVYVAWMSASRTLKVRRSTNGGTTWKPAKTIATNAQLAPPTIAASGGTAVVGFGARTSSDYWTVLRRTTNRGLNWSAPISLSPKTSFPSFAPIVTVRGGAYRAIFERCGSNACRTSAVFYRKSTKGSVWGAASRVSSSARGYHYPVDIDLATKTIVMFGDYASAGPGDVFIRRGS